MASGVFKPTTYLFPIFRVLSLKPIANKKVHVSPFIASQVAQDYY